MYDNDNRSSRDRALIIGPISIIIGVLLLTSICIGSAFIIYIKNECHISSCQDSVLLFVACLVATVAMVLLIMDAVRSLSRTKLSPVSDKTSLEKKSP